MYYYLEPNGICYVIDKDLKEDSIKKLTPLNGYYEQVEFFRGEYRRYYASGQAGTSVSFSEDGSHLLIGAPGILEGIGGIVNYSIPYDRKSEVNKSYVVKIPSYQIDNYSYFGYSITPGKFLDSKNEHHFYAVGAPRDENHGKVYIILGSEDEDINILQSKKGSQLGEYFGASVLGVDLNNDSLSDLIVGAPLYSLQSGCDEGKVYVYLSDGNKLILQVELMGDRKSDARFGTAIANIGDLNQDGFADIAVGAPYEDEKGAVYIYLGSNSGVISRYAQKIEASDIHPNLAGFGIHVSRGFDTDSNGYPDILVGSYASSNAVLFRSQPVIQVFPELFFNPQQINVDVAECKHQGKSLVCFHVDACLKYAGKHVSTSLDFQCIILEQDSRGFLFSNQDENITTERNLTLKINTENCLTLQFYFYPDIKDIITPVPIHFSCDLVSETGLKDEFDKTFPVIDYFTFANITREIPFHSGCANENECYSDLIVTAELLEMDENGLITLGNVTSVSVEITVQNEGEPAYLSQLIVHLPPELPIINKDFCDSGSQDRQEVLVCDLGNPLKKGKQVKINIKLDLTKVSPHTKYLEIHLQSVSNSSDTNPDDNIVTLPLRLITSSDISISGNPSQYLIMYDKTEHVPSIITHKYTVMNFGPSPVHTIHIVLYVPNVFLSFNEKIPFIYFTDLKTDSESEMTIPATCDDTNLNIKGFPSRIVNQTMMNVSSSFGLSNNFSLEPGYLTLNPEGRAQSKIENDQNVITSPEESGSITLSCDRGNVECVALRCSASPFSDVRKFAQISVSFEIDFEVLKNILGPWYQITLVTTGSISVSDSAVIHLHHHPEIAQVKTVLLQGGPEPHKKIPPWLYFASMSIGIILLLLILTILMNVGFFKRREKDILKGLEQLLMTSNIQGKISLHGQKEEEI